ncbi:hypothetical protein [Nonomuraea jabiensis]|uniref:Uncharacterized protein n=1 Tax=Nonomuraea jabiensis TaxID=882448 RepID=A0A7W9GDM1_9ACTN|nr:hypothetical protein [Nonomuraea jabiensis]
MVRHERLIARVPDHYLEALVRKPGALPGATALEPARVAPTAVHDAWWAAVRRKHRDAAGTEALIDVLLLHRRMEHRHVVAGFPSVYGAGIFLKLARHGLGVVADGARSRCKSACPEGRTAPHLRHWASCGRDRDCRS